VADAAIQSKAKSKGRPKEQAKPKTRASTVDADVRSLVTPEGVDLRLRLAEVGQRLSALILDELIMGAVFIGATIAALILGVSGLIATRNFASGEAVLIVWLLAGFLLRNFYFIAFELSARAATPGKRVVVCSEHTHSSTAKAARLLELELRTVPGDEHFAMRLDDVDLTDACALVATIGTTSSASIDPVPELAARCADAGVWLHVDAAYAGSAAVCPELRSLFSGWERADSVGVNPHKWLLTPMDCSAFWSRRPEDLRNAFSLVPEYLRVREDVVSLSEYGMPLGRRFRALKLWAVLRCHGRAGLQATIREHLRLAELFEGWVREEDGWEVCAPRHFSLVCFRRDASDAENAALLERVNASGEAFLSHTRLAGRFVLRLAIGNGRTTEEDVRRAWDVLLREARG